MKTNLDRIISIATLMALVVAVVLIMRKPPAVVQSPSPTGLVAGAPSPRAGSTDQKPDQPESTARPSPQPSPSGEAYTPALRTPQNPAASPSPKSEPASSDVIGAAISQALGASAGGAAALTPDSDVGSGGPNIKDQKVDFDGDVVHGKFLTEIAGKDVWITISGHMGQKDGYATFEPTEFKVGEMDVPVSLVNPALQRKLAEERDRLKIGNNPQ